jgi:putative tryptophan/tyrosine transport system substrate-binding protein
MGSYREHVEAGGLMACGFDLAALSWRLPDDADQIFKGAKPGDIPIHQSTTFDLLINLKTAKSLGLALSPALLARVAEIIN